MRRVVANLHLAGLVLLLAAGVGKAQYGNMVMVSYPGVPSGSCSYIQMAYNQATGAAYTCSLGAWSAIGGGGGGVSSVSAGNLSPLFTASVATPTTTPAISFTLSNAGAFTVFGNPTSVAAAPVYTANPSVTSVVLNGATSGSTTLSASATGGTLNLGSSSATVSSAGALTVTSCSGCGGGGALSAITGSAAQATGTETATGNNYTWAGVETTSNLDFPFSYTNANSTNNNTTGAAFFGTTGTSTGGIPVVIAAMGSTANGNDIFRIYNGGSVSNGTYTTGTLEFNVTMGGIVSATAFQGGNAGTFQSKSTTGNIVVQGGQDVSGNLALGGLVVRGADQSGAGGASSTGGSVNTRGGANSGTNAASAAGSVGIAAGISTGATQGLQGIVSVEESFVKGATVTQWNVECITAAMTVQDCAASPGNAIGVAAVVNTNTVLVVVSGETWVNASAAVTIGNPACAGTTAGKVTDSGSTAACANGTGIGVSIATSGAFKMADGTTATTSTTLPLISLRFD